MSYKTASIHPDNFNTLCLFISIALVVFSLLIFFTGISTHTTSYLLLIILSSVMVIPLGASFSRKEFDIFEIILFISFLYYLYFGIRTFFVLNTDYDPRLNFSDVIDKALLYTALGFLAMMAGYYSKLPNRICKKLPCLDAEIDINRVFKFLYLLWALVCFIRLFLFSNSLFARWIGYELQGIPSWINSIGYLSIFLGRFGLTLGLICYFSGMLKNRSNFYKLFVWGFMVPTEIGWCIISGEKKFVVFAVIALLLAYHYLKKKISFVHGIAALICILFVIFPFINAYRQAGLSFYTQTKSYRNYQLLYEDTLSSVNQSTFSAYVRQSGKDAMWRFPGIDSFSIIIKSVPEIVNFQMGATMFSKLVIIIPKFIFEGKDDIIRQGAIFNRNYFENTVNSDSPITHIGELYMNFGMFGVVAGMFLLGLFYKTIYVYFIQETPTPLKLFLYIPFFFSILKIEADIGIVYVDLFRQMIILLVISKMITRGRLFSFEK